jgi:hypothetical protein
MIKLKDLLTEITLGSVAPYLTTFNWSDEYGSGDEWSTEFVAEEPGREPQPILMNMHHWAKSQLADSGVWEFAFYTRTPQRDGRSWTVRGDRSAAQGHVNYLRLIMTIGLALRDFARQVPGVDVIDITGSDEGMGEKGAQKSAIYRRLLDANPQLSEFGTHEFRGKLYLVRRAADTHFNAAEQREREALNPDAVSAAFRRAQADAWTPTAPVRLTRAERERMGFSDEDETPDPWDIESDGSEDVAGDSVRQAAARAYRRGRQTR